MPYRLYHPPHDYLYHKRLGRSFFYARMLKVTDLPVIHQWVHHPYAHQFWQMQVSLEELVTEFSRQKAASIACQFLICHGTKPIALFEVYHVIQTEMAKVYKAEKDDYGIHLLMAPPEELFYLKKLVAKPAQNALQFIVEMLFSSFSVNRIIAEPDARNRYAHLLAERAGFTFFKNVELPDKLARLYVLSRAHYHQNPL